MSDKKPTKSYDKSRAVMTVVYAGVGVISAMAGEILPPVLVIALLISFVIEEASDKIIICQEEIISLQAEMIKKFEERLI